MWTFRSAFAGLGLLALSIAPSVLAPPAALAQEDGAEGAPMRVPAVTVAAAETREFVQRAPISGTLVPREEVLVVPGTGGYGITELTAEIGDRVEAGDVLARLDDRALRTQAAQAEAEVARAEASVRQAQSQVASAEATLTQARQALDRTRQLRERGAATQAALDEAQAAELTARAGLQAAEDAVGVAEAQVRQARAALDLARVNPASAEIKAPAGGVVSARSGQVGAIASASGEPLYRIIRDALVEVEAEVIETDLALVAAGDPAELDVAGLGRVPGTVRLVAPVVDPQSRLGTVRIAPEGRESLRPGVFVGGWITVERRQGLGVPASAVIADASGAYVLRVEDGVLERRGVTPGLIWQDQREIVEGLDPGDVVVARAGAFFGHGDVIRPVGAGEAETASAASEGAAQEAGAPPRAGDGP